MKNEMQTKTLYRVSELAKILGLKSKAFREINEKEGNPLGLVGNDKVHIADIDTWVEEWKRKHDTKEYYADKIFELAKQRNSIK